MPLVSTLVNTTKSVNFKRIIDLYTQIILPRLQRNKGALVPLGAATALTLVLFRLYQRISKPPAHLRHLPYCNLFACLKYYIGDGFVENYSKEVILPTVQKNDVFARFTAEGWVVDIADPIAAKQMLLKTDAFPKSDTTMGEPGTLIQRFLGGPNIVFLNGADWKRHRKIANPAFHRAFPVKLFGRLTQTMFSTIEELGEKINVMDLFTRLTLDVIGTAGFGFNFNALTDNNNEWVRGYNNIKEGMVKPFFILFPTFDTTLKTWFPSRRQAHKDLDDFLAMMEKIIENKRCVIREQKENNSLEDNEKDLLTLMIESEMNDGDGQVLSNEELKSNLCIFFLAGHDTTAFALSCALYELAMNPDIQDKARQEIIDILGDDPLDVLPTVEQTKQMPYLNTIIKETLRLHDPLLTTTSRKATEDCELGGNFIPKGTLVSVDIYSLHRNPKVWKDPLRFDPDRFAPGGEAERQPGSGMAWVPFSNGGRQCIGMNFSLVQQRVVLAMLLRKYTFHIPRDCIHTNGIQSRGIAFGIISIDDLLIEFKRRY